MCDQRPALASPEPDRSSLKSKVAGKVAAVLAAVALACASPQVSRRTVLHTIGIQAGERQW
jgi:hypothetical protein